MRFKKDYLVNRERAFGGGRIVSNNVATRRYVENDLPPVPNTYWKSKEPTVAESTEKSGPLSKFMKKKN
jgi:hypothetical protein